MKKAIETFKLLSDETRIRILMLLDRKEMCVCQIMGVLGVSQPMVSRNLSLLSRAGFLDERKEGKLSFYSIRRDMDEANARVLRLLKAMVAGDERIEEDSRALIECREFQKKTGRCDMETFRKFMEERRRKREKEGVRA